MCRDFPPEVKQGVHVPIYAAPVYMSLVISDSATTVLRATCYTFLQIGYNATGNIGHPVAL